jgi:hypothetical protein
MYHLRLRGKKQKINSRIVLDPLCPRSHRVEFDQSIINGDKDE